MNKQRVTQREIARESGVSQTAVSLILSGDLSISIPDATRERVLITANALGYVPQAAARALVQGRSQVIALILNDPHAQIFSDPYLPNVMSGISQMAELQNYRLLVERIPQGSDLSIVNSLLRGRQADGAILVNLHIRAPILVALQRDGFPLVYLDSFQQINLPTVNIDHVGGVALAVAHLVQLGHTRIGCIPYTLLDHPHLISRFESYVSVLKHAGIELDMEIVVEGRLEPETGAAAMRRLIEHPRRPTAVFAMNDSMALGAIYACAQAGISIPDEMAIVGYDDMRFAAFTVPSLTTVRAPEVELGRQAAKLLLAQLTGELGSASERLLKTELIIRQSCGGQMQPK